MVETGRNGSVQLLFADETRIVVGPGSRLVIDEIVMQQSNRASRFSVNALGGTFSFLSGKSAKKAYKINTPTATMGIRGTIFDFYVENSRLTRVVLFEGEVDLCPKGGRCGSVEVMCSMSQASNTRTTVLTFDRERRNKRLREDFPYVVDQSQLRSDFQAPTRACGNIKEKLERKETPTIKPPSNTVPKLLAEP